MCHDEYEAEAEGCPQGEGEDDGFGDDEVCRARDGGLEEGCEGRARGWGSAFGFWFLREEFLDDGAAGFTA